MQLRHPVLLYAACVCVSSWVRGWAGSAKRNKDMCHTRNQFSCTWIWQKKDFSLTREQKSAVFCVFFSSHTERDKKMNRFASQENWIQPYVSATKQTEGSDCWGGSESNSINVLVWHESFKWAKEVYWQGRRWWGIRYCVKNKNKNPFWDIEREVKGGVSVTR